MGRDETMRCLWLTRNLPYPPFYGGDAIYSSRLIRSLADCGVEVATICYENGGSEGDAPPANARLRWNILPSPNKRSWHTILSLNPSIACRFESSEFAVYLRRELENSRWDAIIVDHIGMAWLIEPLSSAFTQESGCPLLIYVSHNHEATVRRHVAMHFRGNPFVRAVLRLESWKVRRLERRVVQHADIVTVNTKEDGVAFRLEHPNKMFLRVLPGYEGRIVGERNISEDTPRRVTVLGSFGWLGKRMNLEEFLRVAVPRFTAADAEIEILGHMPASYAARIRKDFPSVLLAGTFDEAEPHLAKTRLGIVPERTGGGFKHKVLSYVFCRVPIAALEGSTAGVPLLQGKSILTFPTMDALVDGSLAVLDDFPRLNQLQDSAFDACSGRFDWEERGRTLATAIEDFRSNSSQRKTCRTMVD